MLVVYYAQKICEFCSSPILNILYLSSRWASLLTIASLTFALNLRRDRFTEIASAIGGQSFVCNSCTNVQATMPSLASIAKGNDAPRMVDLFPLWHSFQVVEVKIGELKERRLGLLNLNANEREIDMYLGGDSKEILSQIEALSVEQGIRLQSLDVKLEEAVAHVNGFEVKAKAKILQLGELPKPDRIFDWEHDTDCGEIYVVKHGFEKEIDEAREVVLHIKQHNQNELVREGMLMSKIIHAITTLAIETTLPLENTKQWIRAITRENLPLFTGGELAAEVVKVQEEMGKKLAAVILEKRSQQEKLAKDGKEDEFGAKEKLVREHQYPNTCNQYSFGCQSPKSSPPYSPSLSSVSFSTVETVCDNCHKRGHDMVECWELDPENKRKALKTLRQHQCSRCQKYGHHENSCWDAFPEKRAAAMQWTAQRNAQRG